MFPARYFCSFLTLTALSFTFANLYGSQAQMQAQNENETAPVLPTIVVLQAQNTTESAQEKTTVTPSLNPPNSASRLFLDLMSKYKQFVSNCSTLTEMVSHTDFNFKRAKENLNALQELYRVCQEKRQAIIDKNCNYFAYISSQPSTELENQNQKAKDSLQNLRKSLVDRLQNALQQNLDNKVMLQKLLNEECRVLEDNLFYDAESKNSAEFKMLQSLKQELKTNIDQIELLDSNRKMAADAAQAKKLAVEQAEQRARDRLAAEEAQRNAAELARKNRFLYKITRGKYALPTLVATLTAVAGLTYGETKHKLISKLIWGKRPEKALQLSWWARNWAWLKHLIRLA